MKQPQTIALTTVIAVAAGIVGFNSVFGDPFGFEPSTEIASDDEQTYLGHLIVKKFDSEGNLVSYLQTDNLVTATGQNCAANRVFGSGFGNCSSPANFDWIALSQNDGTGFAKGNTILAGECTGAAPCGAGLNARLQGTATAFQVANSTVNAIAQMQQTFTKTDAGSIAINSAGLFDALTAGNMFAEKAFTPSGVTLAQNDSIQVTWRITVG